MEKESSREKYDIIIIGAGPGGLSAALYAARYNMKAVIISKSMGGMAATAHIVENYPSHPSINGFKLMELFREHIEQYNVPMVFEPVESISNVDSDFLVKTNSGNEFIGKYLILAMGTEKRRLGIKNEGKFHGKGVHYCASCDAFFYKNKVVGVVGGSDAATTTALLLADIATKVYLIYRKEALRGEPIWGKRVLENKKIEVLFKSNIVELDGDKFLSKIKLDTGKELDVDGVFIEIGADPKTEIVKDISVDLDKTGYILVDKSQRTNIDKVYAVGDVTNNELKQIITASSEGAIAAFSVHGDIKRKNA